MVLMLELSLETVRVGPMGSLSVQSKAFRKVAEKVRLKVEMWVPTMGCSKVNKLEKKMVDSRVELMVPYLADSMVVTSVQCLE